MGNETMISEWGYLLLRGTAGVIIAAHGFASQKPQGREKVEAALRQMKIPLPSIGSRVVSLVESWGGILVALGLGTRLFAFMVALVMLGATFFRIQGKIFLNGFDYPLFLFVCFLSIAMMGSGLISLDFLFGEILHLGF